MARAAIFNHWRMFKGKGTLLVRVAVEAEIVFGFRGLEIVLTAVGIMAIETGHFVLTNRMTGRIIKARHNIKMAALAIRHLFGGVYSARFRLVNFMATGAAHTVHAVLAATKRHKRTGCVTG